MLTKQERTKQREEAKQRRLALQHDINQLSWALSLLEENPPCKAYAILNRAIHRMVNELERH